MEEIIVNPILERFVPVLECKNEVMIMETIVAYDCQIVFPRGVKLESKLEEVLKPYNFEEWKLQRLKKLLVNFSKRNETDGTRVKEISYICPCR